MSTTSPRQDGPSTGLVAAAVLFIAFAAKDLFSEDTPENILAGTLLDKSVSKAPGAGDGEVFAQYQQLLAEHQPDIVVKGDNYPPPGFRLQLAQLIGALKMALLLMLVISFDPWAYIGHEVMGPTPQAYTWALENKIFACLMVFFLANMVETQLISTGAFEVSVGGDLVWSKLEKGRVPQPRELIPLILDRLGKAKQAVDATLADQL